MSKQARNAAELLPKPIKPLKRVVSGNVVSAIRESRDSAKANKKRTKVSKQ